MRTDEPGHDAAYCWCDAEEVGDGVGVEELVLRAWGSVRRGRRRVEVGVTYGDFLLCDDHCGVLPSY